MPCLYNRITCQKEEFDFLFYESLALRELAQKMVEGLDIPIAREGFTVVEWGGFFLDKLSDNS